MEAAASLRGRVSAIRWQIGDELQHHAVMRKDWQS
jgi:hypothetical protein